MGLGLLSSGALKPDPLRLGPTTTKKLLVESSLHLEDFLTTAEHINTDLHYLFSARARSAVARAYASPPAMEEGMLQVRESVRHPDSVKYSRSGSGGVGNIFKAPGSTNVSSTRGPAFILSKEGLLRSASQMTQVRFGRGGAGNAVHV